MASRPESGYPSPQYVQSVLGVRSQAFYPGSGSHLHSFASSKGMGRTVTRKSSSALRKGAVGKVRDIQSRISELERSATAMYQQHAGAALALEREIAALREERQRVAEIAGGTTIVIENENVPRSQLSSSSSSSSPALSPMKRPGSAPSMEAGDKARQLWMLPASRAMRQGETSRRLTKAKRPHTAGSRPVQRGGAPSESQRARKQQQQQQQQQRWQRQSLQASAYSAKAQRAAAARLSSGVKAHPDPWELPDPVNTSTSGGGAVAGGDPQEQRKEGREEKEENGGGGAARSGAAPVTASRAAAPRPKTAPSDLRGWGTKKQLDSFMAKKPNAAARARDEHHRKKERPSSAAEQVRRMEALSSPQQKALSNFVTYGGGYYDEDRGMVPAPHSKHRPTSAAQRKRMDELSTVTPGRIRPKVVTEGISKSTVDWVVHYAAQTPGPGQYRIPGVGDATGGQTFSTANPLSQIDLLQRRSAETPGPGQYHIPGVGDSANGQGFSTANPKTEVDFMVYESKQKPGPGQYSIKVDNKGRKMMGMNTGGFSTANPLSQIDLLQRRSAETPGPGQYHIPGVGDSANGQGFSTANPKSHIDWAVFEANSKPGPGQYAVDKAFKANDSKGGGSFSTANPKSQVEFLCLEASKKPGPGQYGAPKPHYVEKGGSGKFPFVYRPQDPKLAHLTKG